MTPYLCKRRFKCLLLWIIAISVSIFVFSPDASKDVNANVELPVFRVGDNDPPLYHDSLTDSIHDPIRGEPVRCLFTNPPLQNDEVSSTSIFETTGLYCAADAEGELKWDLDFNVERSYKFGTAIKDGGITIPLETDGWTHRTTDPNDGIPKIFHFIWTNAVIPANFVRNLRRFQDLHRKWVIHFWTLPRGRDFVKKYEPQLLPTYDGYDKNVSRADALRYVLVYHLGGAYFDLDTYPKIPLDNLTTLNDCIVGAEPMENAVFVLGRRSILSNAGFLCKPKHAFFRYVIDTLPLYGNDSFVLTSTGPGYFSTCLNAYINIQLFNRQEVDVTVPVNVSVVRHEYFEFVLHKFVDVHGACKDMIVMVDYYIAYCHNKRNSLSKCRSIRENMTGEKRMAFKACMEWSGHGKDKRNISRSVRYVDHWHLGTHISAKSLRYAKETNISRILPHAIIHL